MKLAFIGTYHPGQCCIVTFTHNRQKAVISNTHIKNIAKHAMIKTHRF